MNVLRVCRWPVYLLLLSLLLIPPVLHTEAAPPNQAPPPKLTPNQRAKVEPTVWRVLSLAGHASVLIHLDEAPSSAPLPMWERGAGGEGDKISLKRAVAHKLQAHAQTTQAGVRALLGQAQSKHQAHTIEPLWIVNAIAATVDHATLQRLAVRDDVVAIRLNRTYPTAELLPGVTHYASSSTPEDTASSLLPWGLQRIGADRVWRELGLTGEGVVVATVDTGAQWTHPALRPSYLGQAGQHDYAWFDAAGESPTVPIDLIGHGTHVLGTLVGNDGQTQTGVAPGSRWMAVRIFGSQGATDVIIHRAFQWLLAPTDTQGQNPDPSRAPDLVNHSWGHPNGANPSYAPDVRRLREAGILQVFAAGNEGSLGEGTLRTPGAFDTVLAVGNTTPDDQRNAASSQGPAFSGVLKPDLSAPGTQILSTFPPDDFILSDGTSMAAPHVTGTAALMRQANPLLGVADIERLLRLTAVDLGDPGPDPQFGAGRLDAYRAVSWALDAGQLTGTAQRSDVTIRGVRQPDGLAFTTQTDSQGVYTATIPSGSYTLTAAASGVTSPTPVTVEVRRGAPTRQDLTLVMLPRYPVTGQVSATGLSLGLQGATVKALGTTFQTTTDATGAYRLDLPSGIYTLEVRAPHWRTERVDLSVGRQPTTADVTMTGAPTVLLVDADAWATDNLSPYYQRALDDVGLAYDTLVITDTRVFGSTEPRPTIQLPSLATLQSYDSVIWVHSYGSPGLLTRDLAGQHDAVGLLTDYLAGGGHLLLIGQDIGYLDGFSDRGRPAYAPDFYRDTLRASLVADVAGPITAEGSAGDLFEGVTVQLSAPTGYRRPGQCGLNAGLCPDVIAARDGATLVMAYSALEGAALRTTDGPGRLVYLAFNVDGGSRPEQAVTLDQALAWLHMPTLTYSVSYNRAAPDATLTYTATLTANAHTPTPGVSVTATVPSGLTVLPASLTGGAVYDAATGVVRWQGTLAAQSSIQFSFQGRLAATAPGGTLLRSQATVETGRAHDTQYVQTLVDAPNLATARLAVTPPTLTAGGALTYTLTLTNTGSQTAPAARLTNPLPAGTTLVPGSLRGGATYNNQTRAIEWSGAIPAQTVPLTYTWTDSSSPGGPAYHWIELSATAGLTPTRVIQPAPGQDDVTFGPLDLGFDFPFYGRWRSQVWIADNGWLSPADTPNVLFEPLRLPCLSNPYCAVAPRPVIAPFWYDLTLTDSGLIKFWTNRHDQAVITWDGVRSYNLEGPYTFQVVLNADGSILFQYRTMAEPVTLAGGGIQDDQGERGVQVYYQQSFIRNGLAVRLVPDGPPPPPTLSYAVRLPSQLPPRLTNTATLTDTTGGHWSLSATAAQTPPDLTASSFATSAAIAPPGSVVTYTLTLRNTGGEGDISLTNPLPDGVGLIDGTLDGGATYDAVRREARWMGSLGVGETRVIRYQARLPDAPLWTTIINTARLDDGAQPPIALTATTQLQAVDLSRSSMHVNALEATSGSVLTYTMLVANAGQAPADRVQVDNPLPAGLSYVPGSVTGGATYDASRNAVIWTGAVPGRGAYHVNPTPYAWHDITATGTPVTLMDAQDGISDWLSLGFPLPFFGETVDRFRISPNGWLSFSSASGAYEGRPLPDVNAPLGIVAPFWTDLQFISRGQILYLAEPDRLTVTWQRAADALGQGEYTFQAILASDGTLIFQYQTLNGDRVDHATVGIQAMDGREGVTVAQAPTQRVSADEAVQLRLPPMPSFTYRARVAANLPLNTVITTTATITHDALRRTAPLTRTTAVRVNSLDLSGATYQVSPALVAAGERVEFRLTLTNSGSLDAPNVTASLSLPDGLDSNTLTPLGGARVGGAFVTWAGRVPAQSSVVMGFSGQSSQPGARLISEARVNPPPGSPRVPPRTVQADVRPAALAGSSLTLLPATVAVGETFTATVALQNSQPRPSQVTLTLTLPAGVDYVAGAAGLSGVLGPVYSAETRTVRWTGEVAAYSALPLSVRLATQATGDLTLRATLAEAGGPSLALTAHAYRAALQLYVPMILRGDERGG